MKLREFKIAFIDEGYRGYSVVSGMHQEQVLPYIRNQTVILHVREVSPELDAAIELLVDACEEQANTEKYFQEHGKVSGAYSTKAPRALEAWNKFKE
jgi:hypothetical protein